MKTTNSIYTFENHMTGSALVEKAKDKVMYDIRKMGAYVKKIGRPLIEDEKKEFIVR